jgi:hypothetical protein
MEKHMVVDGDDTSTAVGYSAALPTQPETGKRKRELEAPAPSYSWQMLHTQQGRVLDKIDRAQAEGNFAILPLLQ